MAHKRNVVPVYELDANELTSAMVGIGMNFAAEPTVDANIEDTLLFASIAGMEQDDLRVLAVLTTWLGVHTPFVNADRLIRLVRAQTSKRVRTFWCAFAQWQDKDRRFARLAQLHKGPKVDLLAVGSKFQLKRHGEDHRFAGTALRVAANVLRDRPDDVLSATELAKHHGPYRWRVIIGPSYRADIWAALDDDQSSTVAELARRTYGSFATAWRVKRDFGLIRNC